MDGNIVLVGFMGAGKSSVGRVLARRRENLGDRPALLGGDHGIRLDEATPEPAGQEPPDRRFTCPHETHQDDVIPHAVQPITYLRTVALAEARR